MAMRRSRYLTVDGLEMHVSEWGDATKPAVVCWHGLTRNGRDFDTLAARLSDSYYVICPDTIGRGLSEWSQNPSADYNYERFEEMTIDMLRQLGIEKLSWIGTSMGGAIGLRLAGSQLKGRIESLVINDIGAGPVDLDAVANLTSSKGIEHILSYTGNPPEFATMSELMAYYRSIYKTFGLETDEEWVAFAEHSARRKDNGTFSPDYDPRIVVQFERPHELLMWEHWDNISANVLLIRGENSDILPVDTAEMMTTRGPGCKLVTVPKLGHAPALNTEEQMRLIEAFLREARVVK